MKSKNLRTSLFLAFFLLISLSNLPPGKWILDLAIDEYHYRYSNNNGTLTYVEYKSHDTKGLLRGLNSYKKSFPESKDTIIYRLFKKDILCFWRWGDYIFDKRYKIPYRNWKKIVKERGYKLKYSTNWQDF